jgi:GTP-binding protein YchF
MLTAFDEAQHPLERDTTFLPGVEGGQRSRVVDEKENHRALARGRRGGSAFARWRGARLERESEQGGQHFGGSILHPAPGFAARAPAIIAGMKAGILGLSLVGKSTLFRLLTGYAGGGHGGRPEPRLGVARVPDPRVDALGNIFNPKKRTWATVEYADVPGVSRGEGAALVDLPALRGVDALVHVVRAFESDLVPHPEGSIDPLRDASTLELELILADLGTVERRIERLAANIQKAKLPEDVAERELFLRLKDALEAETPLRELNLSEDERRRLRGYALLSEKPLLLVANLDEDRTRGADAFLDSSGLAEFARRPQVALCAVAAPIEAEMAELAPEDARAFREDLGLAEPGLDRVIRTSYELLGLLSFLTVGEDECRAWTIRRGTKAQLAAGTIHSDIERGFIRAEVVPFGDLVAAGSLAACRERGTLRLEGKEYEVRDGDVINFRFAV